MDIKKLNKVKKGLECCKGYPKKCDACPYLDEVGGSCNYLTEDSLEVINELHSELGCYVSDQGILLQELDSKLKQATVYDLYEMCDYYTCEKNSCVECPLYDYNCDPTVADNIDTINDLVLKWKKEHEEKKDEN